MKQFLILPALEIKNRLLPAILGVILAAGSAHAQSGNALNFDGVDDYVSLPVSQGPAPVDFTIEAWLNYQDNGPWTRVMDFGTGTDKNMFLTPHNGDSGTPRFAITTSGQGGEERLTSMTSISNGWHHLAVTLSQNGTGVTGTLYVDGNVAATNNSMTLTLSSISPITTLYLGRSQYTVNNDPYLKGSLDEVRFYSAALTQAQIQTDMRSSGPSPSALSANLLSYYNFNEGIANGNNPGVTTLTDQSSSGFNGTLYNFTLNGNTSNWVGSTAPLPVTLVSFTAQRQGETGLLAWATASELNNAYFEVERSFDGTTFRALGRVAGTGTTAQAHTYQFTDAGLARYASQAVYYRLRQVDVDGTSTYSPVCTLPGGSSSAVTFAAFPTRLPAGQPLQLAIGAPQAGPASLLVTDALGHLVLRQTLDLAASPATYYLPQAGQWAPGLYIVRVQQGTWQQATKVACE